MGNHRLGKNAKEAELNGKETTRGSFQWEITGLQYLAYLSGKKSEEAELNGKEGTTWGSFQQEISSLGVLNWTSSFQNTYSAKPLSLSMGKKGQPGTHFNGKYISKKIILYFNGKSQVKLEVGVSGFMDILISNMYSARPLSLNGKEGTPRDSFQWEISEGNEFYISMGNYMLNWR